MLPDYPKTKERWWKFYMGAMHRVHQHHLGCFGEIKETVMHEGERDLITREDGSIGETVPGTLQTTSLIPASSPDIEDIKIEDIIKSIYEVGRGLADEKAKMILRTIEDATKEAGTHIGPHSDSVEQFFEMVQKRGFDFDGEGRPIWGQFVVGAKETAERIRAAIERINSTPVLRRRMELLIDRKRREFLDREAARKLVD